MHHVTHLGAAQRILADGAIKPKRIRDQSVLNDTRLKVVWLSANSWYPNCVYGNVQFTFNWVDIIKKRKLFWVEPTPENRSQGFRILVAKEIPPEISSVTRYDPSRHRGPVKRQGRSWYCDFSQISEFMLAAKLPLKSCKRIRLMEHDRCRLGNRCPDSGLADWESTARLMAFVLGEKIHSADKALLFEEGPEIPIQIQNGVLAIRALLGSDRLSYSDKTKKHARRLSLVRKALTLYAKGDKYRALEQISRLKNECAFMESVCDLAAAHFRIEPSRVSSVIKNS